MPSNPVDTTPGMAQPRTRIAPLRDAITTFLGVLAVLGLLFLCAGSVMRKRLTEQAEGELRRTAQTAASLIAPSARSDQAERLSQLMRAHTDIADAYTVIDDDGTLRISVDALRRARLDAIPVPVEARTSMVEKRAIMSPPHVQDGVLCVSVFAPIFGPDESVVGAAGIDVPESLVAADVAPTGPIWPMSAALGMVACIAAMLVYRLRVGVRDAMTMHESRLSALELSMARETGAKGEASSVLATMSHELRTPLTAILGFTDLLLDPGYDVTVLRSHAQTIRRNGQHLLNVLNDVLDISKIEAGTMRTEKVPYDPLQVANDVIDLLEPRAREKRIELSFWAGADDSRTAIPPYVDGDAFRVRQILLNLVGNAVKFTEEGSVTLSVRYDVGRSELSFEVADTGVGIEAEELASLFEPFHQADASASRRSQGAGLGLAISKRLALHLGGDIRVQSDPARGSTFTLRVPAEPSGESELAAIAGERQSGFEPWTPRPSWRVLLVEDTLEHQKLFYACLRRAGHSVDVCDNGERALHKMRESEYLREPYTIVLLDLYLPGQDGFTTASEMRAHGYRGPILAITADTSAETREQCLAAGCDDVYAKPFDRVALLTALTRLVRGASLGAA